MRAPFPHKIAILCSIICLLLVAGQGRLFSGGPPPTVTNVTSSTANGTYGDGQVISIQITFSATVNVTGTPLLALNSGGTASYSSGSGSPILTFTYTVGAGQNSAHLDYTSTGALTLNGGTIQDTNSNNANLTLPAPGGAGSLGANKNIVIDTARAVVTNVTSTNADGTYGPSDVISITISFTRTVTVTGTPQLALNSGGTASYSSGSPGSTLTFTYTVGAGQSSADLDYTSTSALTLNGGAIQDMGSTDANLTLPAPGGPGSLGFNKNIVICSTPGSYTIDQIGGSIVSGTTDTGNHGDDQVTTIALPFPYTLYDQTFTSVNVSSNGSAQFTTLDTAFTNQCLPWLTHNYTIYPYWDDLYLVNSGFGIFTSISGSAPNRIFNIEWRAQYFPGSGTANFELRLYEGQLRFDVIYGTVTNGNSSATAGVQQNDTAFTQYFCNSSGGAASGGQSYTLCGSPPSASVLLATINDTVTGPGPNQFDYSSGGWSKFSGAALSSAYQQDEHYAYTTNVIAHFRFHGTQVKIYTVTEPHGGKIGYTLDNLVEVQANNYSATVMGNQLSYTSPMVTDGDHDLVIRVVGMHDPPSDANAITLDKAEVYGPAAVQVLSATINDTVTGSGLNQWDYGVSGWSYWNGANVSSAYQGDEHYAVMTNTTAHFRFSGTQIKIYTVMEPHGGNIGYTLDNLAEVPVSNYSPTVMGNALSYTSPMVADGIHDLAIRVIGSHEMGSDANAITVDKAEVFTPPPQMLSATINDTVTGTGNNQWNYGAPGNWSFYNGPGVSSAYQGDEHYAYTTNVTATFQFTGTQIKIYTVKEPAGGNIGYTLDATPEQIISNYAPSVIGNSLSYESPVVTSGPHTLTIRVTGTREPASSGNAITADKAEVYTAP